MEKKFKDTQIPEDFSKFIAQQSILLSPNYVHRIADVLFTATSKCLGDVKDTTVPKAIVYRGIDNSFLVAAIVEYLKNEDDPTDMSAGQWSYVWTLTESDIENCQAIDVRSNSLVVPYFYAALADKYHCSFNDRDSCLRMMTLMVEMIIHWIKENTKDGEETVLSLEGVFVAKGAVEDGQVVVSIIPDGDMKVLIKNDEQLQQTA